MGDKKLVRREEGSRYVAKSSGRSSGYLNGSYR